MSAALVADIDKFTCVLMIHFNRSMQLFNPVLRFSPVKCSILHY